MLLEQNVYNFITQKVYHRFIIDQGLQQNFKVKG